MSRVIDVFLSSTAQDLAEHRKAVHDRLGRTGLFRCIRQEDFGAQDAGAVEFCRRKSQEADMFVGLIGMLRGREPDGDNEKRSITEMEHDWARDAGRPRYLWVMPEDFPLPANTRESSGAFKRQMAFRKRVMGGGGRVVSQRGFGSPDLLASEIVEQLLTQVVTTDLVKQIQPEAAPSGQPVPSKDEQAPAIAAAVERLAEDKDVDLLALAKDPKGIDVAELEAKLLAREKELEEEAAVTAEKRAEYWRHIGTLAFLDDTKKALAAYVQATTHDPSHPEGWRYLGELQYRLSEFDEAQKCFRTLQHLADMADDNRTRSIACSRLGWVEEIRCNWALAEQFQKQSLVLAEAAKWEEGVARACGNLGNIYRKQGNLGSAEEMQLKALMLFEQIGVKDGIAKSLVHLGIIHQTRGDFPGAEERQLKALRLFEEIGSNEGAAVSYGNLGCIYDQQDLGRAEEAHLKALQLNEQIGRKQGITASCGFLGHIYYKKGDLERAENMLLKALGVEEELGRKRGMSSAYKCLANIYHTLGALVRAEEMYLNALALDLDLGNQQDIAITYTNLGVICLQRGDLDRSEDMQQKALTLNKELGRKEAMACCYRNLAVRHWDGDDDAEVCKYLRNERDLWREMGLEDKAAEAEKWLRLKGCREA
jgi:tetratricopeptide (TPR) repeat protein